MKRRNFILGASTLAVTSLSNKISFGNNYPYDVAIIGAGLAGLNAALILEDMGLKTIVIEANSRVGGKLLTAKSLDGNQEIGGTSIGSGYQRLIKVIDKNVPTSEVNGPMARARGASRSSRRSWTSTRTATSRASTCFGTSRRTRTTTRSTSPSRAAPGTAPRPSA